MNKQIRIGSHIIAKDKSVYIIAEMSANHNMDYDRAKLIIEAAAKAGADAIKLQTYTPDTITIDCDSEYFMTQSKIWEGMTLYDLYKKSYTPWEWHEGLKEYANSLGLDFFSSPFDTTAVDFLAKLDVPAYKISSFEINDIPLINRTAKEQKPVIISTGIAYVEDIELALQTCHNVNNDNVILLKCVSEYPTSYEEMNLNVISTMEKEFDCIVGLSDHSLGSEAVIASVALGARVIEKHLTLSRDDGGSDAVFSMEPQEFADMVRQVRNVEKALGSSSYQLTDKQIDSRTGSRSLFVVKDIKEGEKFTEENIKSIRPGVGMHTKYYWDVLGKEADCNLQKGTPMSWEYVKRG